MNELRVSADGSALRNPNGPAGWCWFLDESCWASGGWERNTNNVAELTAVQELLTATSLICESLVIETDSRYTINALTTWIVGWRRSGWRTAQGQPVKNAELIVDIDRLLVGRVVLFEWVKGHAGHPRQERADDLARAAATAIGAGRSPASGPGWRH